MGRSAQSATGIVMNNNALAEVGVEISVVIGHSKMPVHQLLKMGRGAVIELDRVETIHPFDATKTMGRFFAKGGPCLYMCFAETDRPAEVRERALAHAADHWTGPRDGDRPDNQFLHPRALGGVMLGVSRTTWAWSWSGAPERIAP